MNELVSADDRRRVEMLAQRHRMLRDGVTLTGSAYRRTPKPPTLISRLFAKIGGRRG